MWPPSSDDSLLACSTVAIAFQRMSERSRCSTAGSPGICCLLVDRDRVDVRRAEVAGRVQAAPARVGEQRLEQISRARSGPSWRDDGVERLEPLAVSPGSTSLPLAACRPWYGCPFYWACFCRSKWP